MKRILKIDEENIIKSNLRISSLLFAIIIIIFIIIYIPRYFKEYQELKHVTEKNHVSLFKKRMKDDVQLLENTINHRIKINQELIKETILDQTKIYFSFAKNKYDHYKNVDKLRNSKILELLIEDFSELFLKDFNGLSFIGYEDQLKIYKDGKLLLQSKYDWSTIKKNYKEQILSDKLLELNHCFDKLIENGNTKQVYIKYLDELKLFVGKIYCEELVKKILEKKITEEINASYKLNRENYIFIYKLLKIDGGKDFAKMVVNPNRLDLVGKVISDDFQDVKGNFFRREFMQGIRKNGESFATYWYLNPIDSLITPKTAYFKLFNEFDWIIAKGFYYTQINKIIKSESIKHRNDFIKRILLLITLMSLALFVYYHTFKYMLKKQEKRLKEYKSDLLKKNLELEKEISLSKSRQNELENLNTYITNLYDLAPVGIVLIRVQDKTIDRINQTALNLIGYNIEDVIGKKCHVCFCPAIDNNCPVIEKGQFFDNSEKTIVNSKKEIIPVLKNAKRITINNEDFILESFIDITEIKKYQNELIDLRESAEEANIAKSRFLANMSHEIRTPMNVIMGMSNLLLGDESDEEKKDLLESIKISSETLLNIINDILDLSKIESGKFTIEKIPFNFFKFLSSIKDISLFKAKEKKIEFSVEYQNDEIPNFIIGDQVKLKQILVNLIGNAVKFTDDGSVKLILNTAIRSNDEVKIKFSVVDTGIGISKKALKNIFERFTQADISTTRKYGGTGLGLTICEKLLSILGSRLEVISVENEGSEFYFELSFKIALNEDVSTDEELSNTDLNDLKSIKILIAEDNILNQKLIRAILNQKNLNFTIVNNGQEVVNILNNEVFDIILMDGQMPVMDGLEATNIIRNSDFDQKNIPIIALTASALIGDRKKFLDSGMNDYISKPIDTLELFDKILHYTSNKKITKNKPSLESGGSITASKDDKVYNLINITDFVEKKKIFKRDVYIDILNLLLEDLEKKLDIIFRSLENNDTDSLELNTHSLKGIVTNFDVPLMNELCIELDKVAIEGDREKIKLQLDKIELILPQYKSEISDFISTI